ncbi:Chloroperoxidase [Zopfochytrium polystomum]|nr:Chloroperoxidase [Zopfochytrium polystomum]
MKRSGVAVAALALAAAAAVSLPNASVVAAFPASSSSASLPSPFQAATASDPTNSSPCPLVNALANHGILAKHNLTALAITKAAMTVGADIAISSIFGVGAEALTSNTTIGINPIVLDLVQVGKHNGIEHDASLSRSDAGLGDPFHLNKTLYAQLKSFVSDPAKKYLSFDDLADYRLAREADSKARNPAFKFGLQQQFLAYAESSLLLLLLADPADADNRVRIDWMDVLFQEERLPFDLGWKIRPLNIVEILAKSLQMRVRNGFEAVVGGLGLEPEWA